MVKCHVLGHVVYIWVRYLKEKFHKNLTLNNNFYRSIRATGINHKEKERKKFLLYSLCALSFPLLWTTFTIICFLTNFLPESITPQLGKHRCFLEKCKKKFFSECSIFDFVFFLDNWGYYIFHILPITVITLINSILFIKTAYYCIKVKNEINKIEDSQTDKKKKMFLLDKERMSMLIKLFIVMGVTFIIEVLTSIFNFQISNTLYVLESILDVVNYLQGLLIFCIFMLKKKTIQIFKRRVGLENVGNSPRISNVNTASTTLISRTSNSNQNERKISSNSMTT